MNMNVKMNNKAKTSRLVVAKQMSNLDKIFVVQLKYYLNNKSRVIDDANEIEISSVNGLIMKFTKSNMRKRKSFFYMVLVHMLQI